jgi:hypothetical protein
MDEPTLMHSLPNAATDLIKGAQKAITKYTISLSCLL